MPHTLIITNDFPPRPGGIQTFVYELAMRFKPSELTVLTSRWEGWEEFDASLPFTVVRANTKVLLPTKSTLLLARQIIVETGADSVLFGAAAPLGLLAPKLRAIGIKHVVAITHGHEAGWAITPVTRQLLRKVADSADFLTYLGSYTRAAIGKVLSISAQSKMRQLTPGVDPQVFTPDNKVHGDLLRESLGLASRPVVVCVSRLMERKGQDSLILNWHQLQERVPGAALVIVGDGPFRPKLESMVNKSDLVGDVFFTGKVPYEVLPHWYAVGDVFAMPCRTRMGGWDVEGLGIVYLEASATGLPVIAGNSGGAPDAVLDGVTGYVVDSQDDNDLVNVLSELLTDESLRTEFGGAGRQWVESNWTWDHEFTRVDSMLKGLDPDV